MQAPPHGHGQGLNNFISADILRCSLHLTLFGWASVPLGLANPTAFLTLVNERSALGGEKNTEGHAEKKVSEAGIFSSPGDEKWRISGTTLDKLS